MVVLVVILVIAWMIIPVIGLRTIMMVVMWPTASGHCGQQGHSDRGRQSCFE